MKDMSKDWTKIRAKVKDFIENEIYPKENELSKGTQESREILGSLMQLARMKRFGLWGIPKILAEEECLLWNTFM